MIYFIFFQILYIFLSKKEPKVLSLKKDIYSKDYLNLLNFIKSNGGYVSPKLIPNEISKTNRFIISKEKIKKNEILLFIPEKITISKLNTLINPKCVEAYGFDEDYDYACIIYYMTIDKYNTSSIFQPYYNYLPKFNKTDFITDFTEQEIEIFKETRITEGLKYYYYFYGKALEPVKEKLKKFCEKKNIKYENILEEFKYNYDLALTRNFGRPHSLNDINTMVPYLDLINHSDKNNTHWYYEEKNEGYNLIAMRDIEAYEEITDSYGKYSNSILYKNYGFVIPGNINHEHININIYDIIFDLNIDSLNNEIKNIFETLNKRYGKNKTQIKLCALRELNKKKLYYSKLKTNRFSMNVIIKERIDIINKFIEEIESYNL